MGHEHPPTAYVPPERQDYVSPPQMSYEQQPRNRGLVGGDAPGGTGVAAADDDYCRCRIMKSAVTVGIVKSAVAVGDAFEIGADGRIRGIGCFRILYLKSAI